MNSKKIVALVGLMTVVIPSMNASRGLDAENTIKTFAFMNCTESIVELQLKYPENGRVIAHLPKKNADSPNFFTLSSEYANMENPVLVIRVDGTVRPYSMFKGTYGNAPKNQHRCQIAPGRYKIMADPYKTDKSLLLVDTTVVPASTLPCFPNQQ